MNRPLEHLDGEAARHWIHLAVQALERGCTAINALNVFPVPDRDTGTNMLVTMRSAGAATDRVGAADVSAVTDAAAAGALGGAAGGSGVILACYLRGFADALRGCFAADSAAVIAAFAAGADAAYAAVSDPLEGTILSVARAAATAAQNGDAASVSAAAGVATEAARAELAETTAHVPVLAAAGVVDAGGQGLVVVLDALVAVTAGVAPVLSDLAIGRSAAKPSLTQLPFSYEVQYLLDAPADALPKLRMRLEQLGDSVAIVEGGDRHNVHAHVNDVDAAIEAALDLGHPSGIRVTHFGDQIGDPTQVVPGEE